MVSTTSPVLEETFQNVRKAAEASLRMQQEMLGHWASIWPGLPKPQSAWVDQLQKFRKEMAAAIAETARKHREVLDRQYQAALESLDAALNVADASNAEEFRRRSEQFCRKAIDCVRETSETQIREFQEMLAKWTEVLAKAGP
jgi:hypothetical protein